MYVGGGREWVGGEGGAGGEQAGRGGEWTGEVGSGGRRRGVWEGGGSKGVMMLVGNRERDGEGL